VASLADAVLPLLDVAPLEIEVRIVFGLVSQPAWFALGGHDGFSLLDDRSLCCHVRPDDGGLVALLVAVDLGCLVTLFKRPSFLIVLDELVALIAIQAHRP